MDFFQPLQLLQLLQLLQRHWVFNNCNRYKQFGWMVSHR